MPGLDGVMAVSAALVPRWDRGRSRRQLPSRQGRAGTEPSPAFAVSASFVTVSIELAILDCDPSRSDCQQAASHWHFSRASAHAGFGLGERTIGSNGRADDFTEMMPRSRSARQRVRRRRPPRLRSRRSRWTCVCSRERGENLRAARPIARAIRSRRARQWWTLACRRDTSSQSNTRQPATCPLARTFVLPIALVKQRRSGVARNG
jgi:hypothetical protein